MRVFSVALLSALMFGLAAAEGGAFAGELDPRAPEHQDKGTAGAFAGELQERAKGTAGAFAGELQERAKGTAGAFAGELHERNKGGAGAFAGELNERAKDGAFAGELDPRPEQQGDKGTAGAFAGELQERAKGTAGAFAGELHERSKDVRGVVAGLRGAVAEVEISEHGKAAAGAWYEVPNDRGLAPWNLKDLGNNRYSMTLGPMENAVRMNSKTFYTGGKFQVKVKTAAVMPGVITSIYLASGSGRTGDFALGQQDELDLEWKGNAPSQVQTNVFLQGGENLQLIDLHADSSQAERLYGIEWNDHQAIFSIDGREVRRVNLSRRLKPMQLFISTWTTMGGWPGLISWAGKTEWAARNYQPITAIFEVVEFPDKEYMP